MNKELSLADGFKGEKAIVTPKNIRELQAGNPVTRQMYITHIGYYPKAKYHFRERLQGAPENILIYCASGKGWIQCRGEKFHLSDNQMFIIPAHTPHSYGADLHNPWSIYWLHFCGDNSFMFADLMKKPSIIADTATSRQTERLMLFESMFQNLEMGYNTENLEYITFCLMYFLASVKYLQQYREIKNVKKQDTIQKSILFMKDNLERDFSLKELSQHVGYSASHLIMLFKKSTSFSPMEYHNQLKIQKACSYLQFSDLKIKEIAFRLCFCDTYHFSNTFRKEMDVRPSEYRKRYNDSLRKNLKNP
jgi:AraC-like DNA-binding protein